MVVPCAEDVNARALALLGTGTHLDHGGRHVELTERDAMEGDRRLRCPWREVLCRGNQLFKALRGSLGRRLCCSAASPAAGSAERGFSFVAERVSFIGGQPASALRSTGAVACPAAHCTTRSTDRQTGAAGSTGIGFNSGSCSGGRSVFWRLSDLTALLLFFSSGLGFASICDGQTWERFRLMVSVFQSLSCVACFSV